MTHTDTDDARIEGTSDDRGGREVVVPMALYKRVTVFGTLIAILTVLFGFMSLDAALYSGSFLRVNVQWLLGLVGVTVPAAWLSIAFAVLGLAFIAFGAGAYVLSTRFRTEGMGTAREEAPREVNDG
jgi:uncharacterized membrane protein